MKTTTTEQQGRLIRLTVPLVGAYAALDAYIAKNKITPERFTMVGSFHAETKHMTGFIIFVADEA